MADTPFFSSDATAWSGRNWRHGLAKRLTVAILSLIALEGVVAPSAGAADGLVSQWHAAYNSKVRLVGGLATSPTGGSLKTFAGVELALQPDWKTYWRMPGDSGGLAPMFTFEGSRNLADATVFYPVPQRIPDPAGTSIGYKGSVVFPIAVTARDRTQPVELAVKIEYGICRDICVPAEAALALTLPADAAPPAPDGLQKALLRVPVPAGAQRPRDPTLSAGRVDRARDRLIFEVAYPAGAQGIDLFVEAPDGIYLPLPKKIADEGRGRATFELDLSDGVEIAEISGKRLTLTLVASTGQAEATWTAPDIPPK